VLVIATERLAWQRGQNALMLFAAMAGVRRFILLDARGGIRDEARTQVFAKLLFESRLSSPEVLWQSQSLVLN